MLDRQGKKSIEIALRALKAIVSGSWTVDGACDPDFSIEAIHTALMEDDQKIAQLETVQLANTVVQANISGDFVIKNKNDVQLLAIAKKMIESSGHTESLAELILTGQVTPKRSDAA